MSNDIQTKYKSYSILEDNTCYRSQQRKGVVISTFQKLQYTFNTPNFVNSLIFD